MTDLAERVEARVRAEWPGIHTTALRGIIEVPPIRDGGATDALVKFLAQIVRDESSEVVAGTLRDAAADAENVARLLETPFNQCTNADHSYLRYHDLASDMGTGQIRQVANWLHGRAALVGAPVPEPSDAGQS